MRAQVIGNMVHFTGRHQFSDNAMDNADILVAEFKGCYEKFADHVNTDDNKHVEIYMSGDAYRMLPAEVRHEYRIIRIFAQEEYATVIFKADREGMPWTVKTKEEIENGN